jgi:hypothetical protein
MIVVEGRSFPLRRRAENFEAIKETGASASQSDVEESPVGGALQHRKERDIRPTQRGRATL